MKFILEKEKMWKMVPSNSWPTDMRENRVVNLGTLESYMQEYTSLVLGLWEIVKDGSLQEKTLFQDLSHNMLRYCQTRK